ncbi:RhoGAP-domain-containing protein [Lentinus tigrinus ALCF2SS1-7]|uniref:RhoGAP-domain-containing protein n=1 Tax=Lentinus tigrinus ALCF2SS1-6 TaxID=1328759 RepID=A0A5C2S2D8_9APHY|nr:RhoGAP-domain-containing protein [Lentinus tigrinus ALCF2SS1-6]RPD78824.1 RhoGAP-domain-containing protein [Lentinus tigrinus ALCF2SS1-7]
MTDYLAADAQPAQTLLTEDRVCPGCKRSVVDENGGVVVAFGQSFFHVDCFRCAKCGNQVTADTNLLLLSDGSPICANCSYSCNVCKQPILDEAIMTGDDSYHAHCFKCKVCKNRIDELVFAKTSQGIYCMNCHNERVARSRRHQARKQERERERAAQAAAANAASGSINSRQGDPRDGQNGRLTNGANNDQGRPTSQTNSADASSPDTSLYGGLSRSNSHRGPDSVDSHSSGPSSAGVKRGSAHNLVAPEAQHRAQAQAAATPPTGPSPSSQGLLGSPVERPSVPLSKRHSGLFIGLPSSPSMKRANPNAGRPSTAGSSTTSSPIDHFRSPGSKMETLSVPMDGTSNGRLDKRKSFDAGIRPLNVLRTVASSASLNLNNNGAPTDYKRSLSNVTPPINTNIRGQDSSRPYSPLRDYFSPEPGTYTDSDYQGSPISPPNGRGEPAAAGRARSASSSAYMSDTGSTRGPPARPTLNLDRMPARSTSLAIPTSFEALEAESPSNLVLDRSPLRSPQNRPSNLSLNGSNFNSQREPWDDVRHSALSGVEFELQRPGSVPPSPSHFVDVPHNIESGTDTEAESEENGYGGSRSSEDSHDRPPSLPPKEPPPRLGSRRPNDLRVDVTQRSVTPANAGESEGTPESSPVERTSHATFIAPALPPIRISMGSADFSDLIRMAGQSSAVGKADLSKLKLDLTLTPPDSAGAPTTPKSDITVLGSADNHATDETPMKRGATGVDRNGATSPESPSSYDYMNGLRRPNDRERARVDPPARSETPPLLLGRRRDVVDPNTSGRGTPVNGANGVARITVTAPGDGVEVLRRRLQDAVSASSDPASGKVVLDASFVQSILGMLDQQQNESSDLKRNLDGMKRASKQYMDGLTVAQTEYDRELKARRDAEAEVTRLRVLLSGQAVRLTAINGDSKRQEAQKQLAREMSDQMSSLERDLSKLKVERDMTMAEVEQLSASRTSSAIEGEEGGASFTRALSMRFDNIKVQYQHELIPLNEQREALIREIAELKASRDAILEETTVLNKRNEELAQLNAQYQRRLEAAEVLKDDNVLQERQTNSFDRARSPPMLNSSVSSTTLALSEESTETKFIKITKPDVQDTPVQVKPRFIKWPGSRAPKENVAIVNGADPGKPKWRVEHVFQQISVLRVARCDHCGDKMWGSQFRCTNCSIAVHTRCIHNVSLACQQQTAPARDEQQAPMAPLPPSMFGRDLVEQVRADSRDEDRMIPVIVEKCIDAVDRVALEYEGIYRKTGGSGQSKMITQLFERGDYASFDLNDEDRFNDICSVTSVLKSYFRALPNPLLTFALHDKFISAATNRDPSMKYTTFNDLVHELPAEHYYTLRALMLHLYRICERSERNLMHARNLGVVFGPTLMRSPDPGAEFSDMAGKALCIEFLVENAPRIFGGEQPVSD